MNIFKYFPYHKTVSSIINGFCLYEDDPDGGAGKVDPPGGGKAPVDPGAGKNTMTFEDVPQDVKQEIFNMGFKKADAKAKGALEKKLLELGITDENLEKWKKMEDDAEKLENDNLAKKGEFEKLKTQMVDQHNKKVVELNDKNTAKDKVIHRLVVRNKLIAEAAIDCVNPTHVANLLESNFKAEEIDGEWYAVPYGNGSKLVDDQGKPQTVKVFIENWLKLEENSYFKKSNVGQGGTGSQGSDTGYKSKDGKIDKKYQTSQGAIKSGLIGGSSILNKKGPIEKSE